MCYSTTTSLLTFAVMAISTIYLIYRNYPNDRWVAIVFISAGIMQLLEYFMWKDQSCGMTNHLATIFAFIVLLIQPIAVLIGAYYFGDLIIDKNKLVPIIWIYGIIIGIFGINWINYGMKNRLCSRPNGIHLDWDFSNWIYSPMMKIFWFMYYIVIVLFFMSRPWYLGVFVVILLIGSQLFSVFFIKNPAWKSLWCWVINFIPVIYIIISNIL
jgi:hypothetical protein